jgi:hypothetical protein
MENKSNYKLKEKYNGLPLEFGSNILVNNNNLTDEYAKKLLEKFEAEVIFEEFPTPGKQVKEIKVKALTKKVTKKGAPVKSENDIPITINEPVETVDDTKVDEQ